MRGDFDPSHWMIVGLSDETGVGRLLADFHRLFPQMKRAVLPSTRFAQNPVGDESLRIASDADEHTLAELLQGIQGVVLFENPQPAAIVRVAKRLGVATVFVPMWEWFNPFFPDWNFVTRFACPNAMCVRMLERLRVPRLHQIPWPIDFSGLPQQRPKGPARVFVHNSGLVEGDDRKAFFETIAAFSRVKGDDLRLILRAQNRVEVKITDPRIDFQAGHLPDKRALYETGDVMVQPSKAEGLGFAVLEAMACGFPVITTDYPPMNEYIRDPHFLVAPRWRARKPVQANYIPHAHLKVPRVSNLARCMEWCAHHDVAPAAQRNLQWITEVFDPAVLSGKWAEFLAGSVREVCL